MARPAPGADRSVAVLELLAAHPDERFTLSEVARRCNLNKATAHALLSALSARGVLLRHPEEKRYSLGPRLVEFGEAARRGYTAADFVHPVLDELAAGTGLWARAWQVRGDQLVCVAQAGTPASGGGPNLLPLAPPVGAVVMAWGDAPSRDAWLARAVGAEVVGPTVAALPVIRDRGYAVTLASDEWRSLTGPVRAATGGGPAGPRAEAGLGGAAEQAARRRGLLMAIARQSLLVAELDDTAMYTVADVAAPVFGTAGEVVLALSVTTLADEPMAGAAVQVLGRRVADAADGLTATSRGSRPGERAS